MVKYQVIIILVSIFLISCQKERNSDHLYFEDFDIGHLQGISPIPKRGKDKFVRVDLNDNFPQQITYFHNREISFTFIDSFFVNQKVIYRYFCENLWEGPPDRKNENLKHIGDENNTLYISKSDTIIVQVDMGSLDFLLFRGVILRDTVIITCQLHNPLLETNADNYNYMMKAVHDDTCIKQSIRSNKFPP